MATEDEQKRKPTAAAPQKPAVLELPEEKPITIIGHAPGAKKKVEEKEGSAEGVKDKTKPDAPAVSSEELIKSVVTPEPKEKPKPKQSLPPVPVSYTHLTLPTIYAV